MHDCEGGDHRIPGAGDVEHFLRLCVLMEYAVLRIELHALFAHCHDEHFEAELFADNRYDGSADMFQSHFL